MNPSTKQDIIAGMKETSRIMEQARRLETAAPGHRFQRGGEADPARPDRDSLFMDPAKFWTWRAQTELGMAPNPEGLDKAAGLVVRLVAADLATGNRTRAMESLIGQSVWLAALAAKLSAKASQVRVSPSSADEQAKLWKLAMQAQRQAAQTLCSAVALGKDGIRVGDG